VCEDVAARSLALPFFPEMSETQVERVAEELRSALLERQKGGAPEGRAPQSTQDSFA
jgi:perosamine synthetase